MPLVAPVDLADFRTLGTSRRLARRTQWFLIMRLSRQSRARFSSGGSHIVATTSTAYGDPRSSSLRHSTSTARPHLELYIRWMQETRRYKPSTVSRVSPSSPASTGYASSTPS